MENTIKENRLVCDYTFAKRLLSFAKQITTADACSYDEKESFISYAEKLLKYQCVTATNEKEIAYLKRVCDYEKYTNPLLITNDGVSVGEQTDVLLFSCMKVPRIGEQVLQSNARYFDKEKRKPNNNRAYFIDKQKCLDYIDFYIPRFSMADLHELGVSERCRNNLT